MGWPGVLGPLSFLAGSMKVARSLRASRRASGKIMVSALPMVAERTRPRTCRRAGRTSGARWCRRTGRGRRSRRPRHRISWRGAWRRGFAWRRWIWLGRRWLGRGRYRANAAPTASAARGELADEALEIRTGGTLPVSAALQPLVGRQELRQRCARKRWSLIEFACVSLTE